MIDKDPRRLFTPAQRLQIFVEAAGKCERCGGTLPDGWQAHHGTPHSKGGHTHIDNGEALCKSCHVEEHRVMAIDDEIRSLAPFHKDYSWQERAVDTFIEKSAEFYAASAGQIQRAYVVEVSPSGGKTIFSMKLARRLIIENLVDRIVWCVPRDSIKLGFDDDARKVDPMPEAHQLIGSRYIRIDTELRSNYSGQLRNYHGVVITYQALPGMIEYFDLLARKYRVMFVFDEAHHGSVGEQDDAMNIWGGAMETCRRFAHAVVCMTGTPLRSDAKRVPFIRYREVEAADEFGKMRRGYEVEPDFSFPYRQAVAVGVARRIICRSQDPEITYEVHEQDGSVASYRQPVSAIPVAHLQKVKNTAFCFTRGIVDHLLKMAHDESELQRSAGGGGDADAAILVIGRRDTEGDANTLRSIANRIKALFGETAVTVESADGPQARERIREFKYGSSRWIVAKEMISEGTNIPRMRTVVLLRDVGNRTFYEQLVHRITRNDADDRPQDAIILQLKLPHLHDWGMGLEAQARIGWEKRIIKERELGDGNDGSSDKPDIIGIEAELSDEFIAIAGADFTDVDPLGRHLHREVGEATRTSRWQTNMLLKGLGKLGVKLDGSGVPTKDELFTIEEQCKRLRDKATRLIRAAAINRGGKNSDFAEVTMECKRVAGISGALDNVLRDHPDPLAAMTRFEQAAKRAFERSSSQRS